MTVTVGLPSRLSGPVDSMARFATAEDVTAVLVVVLPRAAWPGLQAAASLLGACPSQEAVSRALEQERIKGADLKVV